MRAIILFQIGNIDVALYIFQKLYPIFTSFSKLTLFVTVLDTLSAKVIEELLKEIQSNYPAVDYIIHKHKNKGMDIGPFLLQFKYLIQHKLKYDLFLKIHTKTNVNWRNELLNPLINNVAYIKKYMANNNQVGIIGSHRWLLKQDNLNQKVLVNILNKLKIPNHYFDIIDYKQLDVCRDEVKLDPVFYINYNKLPFNSISMVYTHFANNGINNDAIIPHPSCILKYHTIKTYFIGGTMFWAKYDIFYNFFKKYPIDILLYDALEEGYTFNDKETVVHAMERFLCLIPIIMNTYIYGIN